MVASIRVSASEGEKEATGRRRLTLPVFLNHSVSTTSCPAVTGLKKSVRPMTTPADTSRFSGITAGMSSLSEALPWAACPSVWYSNFSATSTAYWLAASSLPAFICRRML